MNSLFPHATNYKAGDLDIFLLNYIWCLMYIVPTSVENNVYRCWFIFTWVEQFSHCNANSTTKLSVSNLSLFKLFSYFAGIFLFKRNKDLTPTGYSCMWSRFNSHCKWNWVDLWTTCMGFVFFVLVWSDAIFSLLDGDNQCYEFFFLS